MAWIIRSGRAGEKRDRLALVRGVVVINWDWLPDLTGLSSGDVRHELSLHPDYEGSAEGSLTKHANEIHGFVNDVALGELVVMPLGEPSDRVAIGRVKGTYEYRESTLSPLRHVVPVEWIDRGVRRCRLSAQAQGELTARATVRRLSTETAAEMHAMVALRASAA